MEKSVEKKFRAECKKQGYTTYKFVGGIGMPDRIVLGSGVVGFAEIKKEGAKLRPAQEQFMLVLRNNGFYCEPVIGEEDIEPWLINFKKFMNL